MLPFQSCPAFTKHYTMKFADTVHLRINIIQHLPVRKYSCQLLPIAYMRVCNFYSNERDRTWHKPKGKGKSASGVSFGGAGQSGDQIFLVHRAKPRYSLS